MLSPLLFLPLELKKNFCKPKTVIDRFNSPFSTCPFPIRLFKIRYSAGRIVCTLKTDSHGVQHVRARQTIQTTIDGILMNPQHMVKLNPSKNASRDPDLYQTMHRVQKVRNQRRKVERSILNYGMGLQHPQHCYSMIIIPTFNDLTGY